MNKLTLFGFVVLLYSCSSSRMNNINQMPQYSGIYPHLAYYNNEGECGTGAVVPWAGSLWVVSYAPHSYLGSSDKLYQITPELKQITRRESIGGTPANRMIHPESGQLFIGPYAINKKAEIRSLSYRLAPGRYTGITRHLSDPAGKAYLATMEEGIYELDVKTLAIKTIFPDENPFRDAKKAYESILPGTHGKGLYSGQGVLIYSNNGEYGEEAREKFDVPSGVLAEWDGQTWKIVRRNQFAEVTGPGGIEGSKNPATDPIWATGWDHKSVLLGLRDNGGWSFFRLPKASHSYDGAHGWNTEWPRIRNVGTAGKADYLMTMHGMFWHFPEGFSSQSTAGIRPGSAYLKVFGDFARWNDRLVFGADDAAKKEFLNSRKAKGDMAGPGQSHSNLWFSSARTLDELGPNTANGAVWLSEQVTAGEASDPFLFAGWKQRTAWLLNQGTQTVTFRFQTDRTGRGDWQELQNERVEPGKSLNISFNPSEKGEWIRVIPDGSTKATLQFSYTDDSRAYQASKSLFKGLSPVEEDHYRGGLLYSLGDNRRTLGILAGDISGGKFSEKGYYELNAEMKLEKKEDAQTADFIREHLSLKPASGISIEESSVLVIDDKSRRWRLPLGSEDFDGLYSHALGRVCREVVTERDLLNVHGTFYELPAENADGYAKIRPVASHTFGIHDFTSYRGLLVMSGIRGKTKSNKHIVTSSDGNAKVWAGSIDDLWKMGKPVGRGGPWKDTSVEQNIPSDPYLIGFYDKKKLEISHDATVPVNISIEVEPVGHGPWMLFKKVEVKPGEKYTYTFPASFQSKWIRFSSDTGCKATTWLTYQ
ncbi:hypothetical protein [Desertivirga xinjiangensis]|uniref:hypothetical protein n=1 Tax=Desertivirga xinjiangensis TaxID=539206 RepID=UPI0021097F84|nr:hypothetical protein [Pedobacter xinjiangensis]